MTSDDPMTRLRLRFDAFYHGPFRTEHHHPANIALHVGGTVASAAFASAALLSAWPALALLYPLVHAVPGLIGHRLFERDADVGDVRVLRRDYPLPWFIAANHRLTFDVLRGRYARG